MNIQKSVLIIEDIPFWGTMLIYMLKKKNIATDWVKNGLLGVQKIQDGKTTYDAIITDIQMPIMNGLEATKTIRKLGFTNPIIGFSSLAEEEDIDRALSSGIDAYFKKSTDFVAFEELLRKMDILND